jgi:hypothetical protein
LAWFRVPATSEAWVVVGFYRHVRRQPFENISPMPADRLSTVGALLRKSPEDCEAE